MDVGEKYLLGLSGRIRALEQLMTVSLIDFANRKADPSKAIEEMEKFSMLTVQFQERPAGEAVDFEAGVMADTLRELFRHARAEITNT